MTHWIPDNSALDEEAVTAEEQRLGDLFELADQLAGDRVAQDAFLRSLAEAERQEVVAALVHANALRMLGNETAPQMQGQARQRLQDAMQRQRNRTPGREVTRPVNWPVADVSSRNTP